MKKIVISVLLSVIIFICSSSTMLANSSLSTTIKYIPGESFTVSIPATVDIGNSYKIELKNYNLPQEKRVLVTLKSTENAQQSVPFKLKQTDGSYTIDYQVKVNGQPVEQVPYLVAKFTKEEQDSANLEFEMLDDASSVPYGNYTDTITYLISVMIN